MRSRVVAIAVMVLGPVAYVLGAPPSMTGAALPDGAGAATLAPLTAVLIAANEPGGGEPGSSGLAAVTIDPANNRLCYELSKITTSGTPAAAHIHKAPAGQNGPVVQPFATPSSNTDGSSSDCVTPADPTLLSGLINDPSGYYVNVHTDSTPAGAIRGQLAFTANRAAATMSGLLEQTGSGANNQGDQDGAGRAIVWVNTAQSTVCLRVEVRDVDSVNATHLHKAPAGQNGAVAVPFDPPADGLSVSCNISTSDAAEIASNPKAYYANVHNAAFPAGALRGQLAPAGAGYRLVARDGGVFSFGQGTFQGSRGAFRNNAPFVGAATTPSREGYWLASADGGVFTFGDAGFFGSNGAVPMTSKAVAVVPTPTGKGYWLATGDGAIFTFGDATFFGALNTMPLNAPIVGMAATPTGRGYWLVGADGGVFTFGDAVFLGSLGSVKLNKPIVAVAVTGLGRGYVLAAADGGVFTFGDAHFFGSTGNIKLNQPVVGVLLSPSGQGYLLAAADGGVFHFGDAEFAGSMGAVKLNAPVVAVTT